MKNKNNQNTRSLDLNKKSISKLNEKTVKGGKEESGCSAIRNTEFCHSRIDHCPTE